MWPFANYKQWPYKNTLLLAISIVVFLFLAQTPLAKNFFTQIGDWGYIGAVITGIFFVMTFTAAPALVVLYYLSESLNPLELALLAGFGTVLGDSLIFIFLKDKVFEELEPIITKLSQHPFWHVFKTPYFSWLTPVIGAIIIASPLPDELGITLLSATRLKKWQFIILSFVLNSVGIYLIIAGARLIFN